MCSTLFFSSTMVKKNSAEYHKMTRTDEGFVDLQYERQKPKFPWGGIVLAIFLLIAGTVLITFSFLLITGHVSGAHAEAVWPCMILGFLMFIPGIYYVRIAWLAYRGYPGYQYEDIPNFE